MKKTATTTNAHTLDASGKKLGRVATAAAVLLMGKNKADWARNTVPVVSVAIINASKVSLSDKKIGQKSYKNFSGYPGGLKITSAPRMIEKQGYSELFKTAIWGMLPKNKLRSKMILNLTISE